MTDPRARPHGGASWRSPRARGGRIWPWRAHADAGPPPPPPSPADPRSMADPAVRLPARAGHGGRRSSQWRGSAMARLLPRRRTSHDKGRARPCCGVELGHGAAVSGSRHRPPPPSSVRAGGRSEGHGEGWSSAMAPMAWSAAVSGSRRRPPLLSPPSCSWRADERPRGPVPRWLMASGLHARQEWSWRECPRRYRRGYRSLLQLFWTFNFVGFYSCWNKFANDHTTQAFMFTDRATDASVVVLAFRGTEPFNMRDWSTDVNLSWLGMGAMGNVHVGFLKALGLQQEDGKDAGKAFPAAAPNAVPGKPLAYYALREELRAQLKKHPKANVVVTGHSLGGALAAVFPALLAFHGERAILDRLLSVVTYGQPRVGDKTFAAFLRANVPVELLRVVYRYDVVPRVPFDSPPVAEFIHGGTCVYFDGWYKGRAIAGGGDAPNPNYFDPKYLLSMYGNAWGDLFKAMFLGRKEGRDYGEGAVSLLYRSVGLLVPGLASHSPRDYVNSVRLGRVQATAAKEV